MTYRGWGSEMLPSPSELQYFLEVAQTQNVSRAAERLGISQPTLSLAIRRLEDAVGTPVLIRSKTGVQLTHAGQKLVTQARQLLQEWEKIRTDTLKDEKEIRGTYTIGCHPSVALYSLPSFLAELLENNPSLEVKLLHDLSRRITESVISFKIDFGIVVNPIEHPDLVIKPLCKDIVELWTSKAPSKNQDPKSEHAVLIADGDLAQVQSVMKQLPSFGMNFKRFVTSSNLEVIAAMVASGAGVGILPGRVAKRIKAFDLKPLLKDGPRFNDQICLVYRADAQRSKASRAVAQAIEHEFDPDSNIF